MATPHQSFLISSGIILLFTLFVNGWSQKYGDEFQSNRIQFNTSHSEWKTSISASYPYPRIDLVAFDANRGKSIILYNYSPLQFLEIDLINGAQKMLTYDIPDMTSPTCSNIVIDSSSNVYVIISDFNGNTILVKANLVDTKKVMVAPIKELGTLLLSDKNSMLIIVVQNVYAVHMSTLKQAWSYLTDSIEDPQSLLIANDLYFSKNDRVQRMDVLTGNLTGMYQIPQYIVGASIEMMSYTGVPGWLMLGMSATKEAIIAATNIDSKQADMDLLVVGSDKRYYGETSNIVSCLAEHNSSQGNVQIFSALNAFSGNAGSYFGTLTSIASSKSVSVQSEWKNNFSGFVVASAHNERKLVVLMDNNQFKIVTNNGEGKVVKTVNSKLSSQNNGGERYVVTGQNNMIYSFVFTREMLWMEAVKY